jgi:hypothetical protein
MQHHVPLRVVAELSGVSLDRSYRLFRLPSAPTPASHAACVPVYELVGAMRHLGSSESAIASAVAVLDDRVAKNSAV